MRFSIKKILPSISAATIVAGSIFLPIGIAHAQEPVECPYKYVPPTPVDTSEVPAPGQQAPGPMPVPKNPIGGPLLSNCGVITPNHIAPPAGMTAKGWVIADFNTGQVLAADDPHGRFRPASTIKLLLAITVVNHLGLDYKITATKEDQDTEGDHAGVTEGKTYTVESLLEGLLLVSGNDCAETLAQGLGGNQKATELMDQTAKALNAMDTRAATPSGLDGPGMSTSPYDLALIVRQAVKQPAIYNVLHMRNAVFSDVDGSEKVPIQSENWFLLSEPQNTIGGKTGYTDDAEKTYAGVIKHGNRTYIITQMYGLSIPNDSYWQQAVRMLDWAATLPTNASVGQLVAPSQVELLKPRSLEEAKKAASSSSSGKIVVTILGLGVIGTLVYFAKSTHKKA